MGDPFSELAERYNSSGGILRQVVRHELVDRGRLGVITRGDIVEGLYGAFREAGQSDPYRSVARLIHLVGRKETLQG